MKKANLILAAIFVFIYNITFSQMVHIEEIPLELVNIADAVKLQNQDNQLIGRCDITTKGQSDNIELEIGTGYTIQEVAINDDDTTNLYKTTDGILKIFFQKSIKDPVVTVYYKASVVNGERNPSLNNPLKWFDSSNEKIDFNWISFAKSGKFEIHYSNPKDKEVNVEIEFGLANGYVGYKNITIPSGNGKMEVVYQQKKKKKASPILWIYPDPTQSSGSSFELSPSPEEAMLIYYQSKEYYPKRDMLARLINADYQKRRGQEVAENAIESKDKILKDLGLQYALKFSGLKEKLLTKVNNPKVDSTDQRYIIENLGESEFEFLIDVVKNHPNHSVKATALRKVAWIDLEKGTILAEDLWDFHYVNGFHPETTEVISRIFGQQDYHSHGDFFVEVSKEDNADIVEFGLAGLKDWYCNFSQIRLDKANQIWNKILSPGEKPTCGR